MTVSLPLGKVFPKISKGDENELLKYWLVENIISIPLNYSDESVKAEGSVH